MRHTTPTCILCLCWPLLQPLASADEASRKPGALPDLPRPTDRSAQRDEQILQRAKVGTTGEKLLAYLKERSRNDKTLLRLDQLVQELGSLRFREREQAVKALLELGPVALPALRRALGERDAEIVRRAKTCLQTIILDWEPATVTAAVRALARLRPDGTVETLLRYLPYASDEALAEEIWFALDRLVADRGPSPALEKALDDPLPPRRAAAAYLVGRWGDRRQRAAVVPLLADSRGMVRLRVAQGLLGARDKKAIPTLVALLNNSSVLVAWQAEEMLHWVAGENAPQATIGAGSPRDRQRCVEQWQAWWRRLGADVDLAGRERDYRRPGLLLVCDDGGSEHKGRVWLCGCDGRVRWQLADLLGPSDVHLLDDGRVLVAEARAPAAREYDLEGKLHWQHKAPLHTCERLPDGSTLLVHRDGITEVTARGTVAFRRSFRLTKGPKKGTPLHCIQRLMNGRILCSQGIGDRLDFLIECDARTGEERETARIVENGVLAEVLTNGNYLLTERGPPRVREVDAEGQIVWERRLLDGVVGSARLGTGTTLAADMLGGRLLELDRAGRIVWEVFVSPSHGGRLRTCLNLVRLGWSPRPPELNLETSLQHRRRGLASADLHVRYGTIYSLGPLGDRALALAPDLIERLIDSEVSVQDRAVKVLLRLGSATLPHLLKGLQDRRPTMRAAVAPLLARMPGQGAAVLPVLEGLLKDEDRSVRDAAVRGLGLLAQKEPRALAVIQKVLKDTDAPLRRQAVLRLWRLGPAAKAAFADILELVNDPDVSVRTAAGYALGTVDPEDDRVVPLLIELLSDTKSLQVRAAAATSLTRVGKKGSRAVPALIKALDVKTVSDPTWANAAQARVIAALGQMGADAADAVPALLKVLRDRRVDQRVHAEAIKTLGMIGPAAREAAGLIAGFLGDTTHRSDASLALVKIGPAAVPVLQNVLKAKDPELRHQAIATLINMGPAAREAAGALAGLLGDAGHRDAARLALVKIGPAAVPSLQQALKTKDPRVRAHALNALGRIGPAAREALPAIREAVNDPDRIVHTMATWAIKQIQGESR
jgi:HEAT repeat protein